MAEEYLSCSRAVANRTPVLDTAPALAAGASPLPSLLQALRDAPGAALGSLGHVHRWQQTPSCSPAPWSPFADPSRAQPPLGSSLQCVALVASSVLLAPALCPGKSELLQPAGSGGAKGLSKVPSLPGAATWVLDFSFSSCGHTAAQKLLLHLWLSVRLR